MLATGFSLLAMPSTAPAQNFNSGPIAVAELPESPRPQFLMASVAQQTGDEKAAPQQNEEKPQRAHGLISAFSGPDYSDAISLTSGQKLYLAFRSATSPVAFGKAFFVAGYHEVLDEDIGFGWGAEGYGKRVGAAYLNSFDSTMIGSGILPSLLHQDPRYFRLGHGSVTHRGLYSVSTVFICHHDGSRKWEPNYSNVGGSMIAGAISNAYYPSDETSAGHVIERGLTSIAWSAVGPVFLEFWPDVSRKLFHHDQTHGLDAEARAADKASQQASKQR
jgi:hypothetical protein